MDAQEARRFEEGTAHDAGDRHPAWAEPQSRFSGGNAMAERLYKTYNALILAGLRSYGRRQARESFSASSPASPGCVSPGIRRNDRRQERQSRQVKGRHAKAALAGSATRR